MIGGFGTDEARLGRNILYSSRRELANLSEVGPARKSEGGGARYRDRETG